MENSKAEFLKKQFVPLLRQIPSDTLPHWGKMTLQQMIEHFSDSMRIASGKTARKELTGSEHLEKARAFLFSDKPFRENTPNPLMPEVPAPVRNKTINAAFAELEEELKYFFAFFKDDPQVVTYNPFFGELDYAGNIQLLYKHAVHHLKQFGVMLGD